MGRRSTSSSQTWTARFEIAPGLEERLRVELAGLGVDGRADKGAVEAKVDPAALLRAQRWSRLASRATIRLATVGAPNLEGLAARVRGLPWKKYVHPRQPVEVHVTTHQSRFKYKDRVANKVKLAIGDALKGPRKPGGRPPKTPQRVGVRLERDKATLRVDASGDLLHRRGWRQDPGRAPLRENLAVAVLHAAQWAPGEPLVDPMTGSGTFAVEAALWTLGRAPGAHRSFSCETWPCWPTLPVDNPGVPPDAGALILAADRDQRSEDRARKNMRRARVSGRIHLEHAAVSDLTPPGAPGLVVLNPPWGDRLGDTAAIARLHHRWRAGFDGRWPDWRVAVVVPDAAWARSAWGANYKVAARFRSGGTPICVLVRTPKGPRPA